MTFSGGFSSSVTNVMVNMLFSGNGSFGNRVTLLVPGGDTSSTMTLPSDVVMTTRISLTLVFVVGPEMSTTIGVMPAGNGIVTVGLSSLKVTPGDPGLRSDGLVPEGAPVSLTSVMYCGLVMPRERLI